MKNLYTSFLLLFVIVTFVNAQNTCTPQITNGLVAYLPFCGNANDETGNGYNGVVTGATLTTDRFGNANSAYLFNGSSDYITLNNSSNISFSNGVSFCAWINPTIYKNASIVDKMLSTGNGFRINTRDTTNVALTPKKIWAESGNYNVDNYSVTTSNQILDSWQFVVGTYGTDDTLRIYFNGQLEGKTLTSGYAIDNGATIFIGSGSQIGYENFDGVIDDISIYNRVITPQEALQLYGTGCAPEISTGLVAQYNFTGNANDVSGNGYNGVITGATLTTDRFGNANSAYLFNGSSDYIALTNSSNISFSNGVSFCAWINPTIYKNASIVDKMLTTGNGFRINTRDTTSVELTPKKIWAESGNYNIDDSSVTNSNQILGNWQFVVGTYGTDNSLIIYFNGVMEDETFASGYAMNNGATIFIGSGSQIGYENFEGAIDDIRIYNRVLTECDVDSLYNLPNLGTTGINSIVADKDFSIYPNPATNQLTIHSSSLQAHKATTVVIMNVLGETMREEKMQWSNDVNISVKNLPAGIYFVQVVNENGRWLGRFVKQ